MIELKEEYLADDINIILEKLDKYSNISVCGNGAILHKELLLNKIPDISICEDSVQKAYNAGCVGYNKYLKKDVKSADTILPVYLRKSQAERMKIEKNG